MSLFKILFYFFLFVFAIPQMSKWILLPKLASKGLNSSRILRTIAGQETKRDQCSQTEVDKLKHEYQALKQRQKEIEKILVNVDSPSTFNAKWWEFYIQMTLGQWQFYDYSFPTAFASWNLNLPAISYPQLELESWNLDHSYFDKLVYEDHLGPVEALSSDDIFSFAPTHENKTEETDYFHL